MVAREKNYYEVLETNPDVSQESLYKSYLQAKNAYSIDSLALYSLMNQDECREMLCHIEEAYSVLSDPNKRRQYDSAHGIIRPEDSERLFQPSPPRPDPAQLKNADQSDKNLSKLVASKRYALDYTSNPDFEQEIERATVFTGTFLRQIREYKNVDIKRMSEMTKISKTYLSSIEDEALAALPALVYIRGFVFQYAKCLKLNPDQVASSYLFHLKKTYNLT